METTVGSHRPIVAAPASIHPYGIHRGGVSWGAVFAGAAAAAALSVILAFLGFGFGMSAISPWTGVGVTAATLSVASILWITITQIAASSLGGYLAGRLRVRWDGVHRDEVYFRDTSHGFLAWAVATLAVGALFASMLAGVVRVGAETAGNAAAVAGHGAIAAAAHTDGNGRNGMDYTIDTLLRQPSTPTSTDGSATAPASDDRGGARRMEVARIFSHALDTNTLPPADATYLAQQIAQRSGISQADAEAQVQRAYTDVKQAEATAKETADKARKAAAYTALWLFVSLLGGAFFASLSATFGGRRRDLDFV